MPKSKPDNGQPRDAYTAREDEPREDSPMLNPPQPYQLNLLGPDQTASGSGSASGASPRDDATTSSSNGYKRVPLHDDGSSPNTDSPEPTERAHAYPEKSRGALYNTGVPYAAGNTGDFNAGGYDNLDQHNFSLPPLAKMSAKNDSVFPDEKGVTHPMGPLGWIGFGLSIFALACLCISFASPYWIQAYPGSNNEFRNMGLWEVCFNNYMHYKDDSQQVYDGCWWVFNPDQEFYKLREWLLPPWFITVQVLVVLTFLAQLSIILIIMLIYLHLCPMVDHSLHQTYAMFAGAGLSFFITILTLIVGVMYAILCGERAWMPRPDLNLISWGYGFWIIQGIFTTAAGVCYFIEAQESFRKIEEQEGAYEDEMTALHEMSRSQLGGFPSQPSFAEPPYGQSSYVGQLSYDQNLPEAEAYANVPGPYAADPGYDPNYQNYDPNYGYDPNYQNYGAGAAPYSYGDQPDSSQPPAYPAYP